MYNVKIVADSVNPVGDRLTTFELTYPRMVHAELMTHRLFSRNSASSRAIPTPKLVARVLEDPVLPKWWGKNQKGMQAQEELSGEARAEAERLWLAARDSAVDYSNRLRALGLHKQLANRIMEPWMFITVIVSSTEYENWFHLRDTWPEGAPPGPAQPEIAWVAREMRKLYDSCKPKELQPGQWHLPYVELDDESSPLFVTRNPGNIALEHWDFLRRISAARCARVSYLTHDGRRDYDEDLRLHDRLSGNGHFSPFEHPAKCLDESKRVGNFIGWRQYRKELPNEHYGKQMP